jgi:hypothetical protein
MDRVELEVKKTSLEERVGSREFMKSSLMTVIS